MATTVPTRECSGFGTIVTHVLPWTAENFAPWAMDPARGKVRCRDCDREYRRSRRGNASPQAAAPRAVSLDALKFATENLEVSLDGTHEYIANPELVALWSSVVTNTLKRGAPPANLVFYGPSGSGKTEGARYLADAVNLPFTKVDAASMTDPESWFGTREVIIQEGQSVTKYVPSPLVGALQQAGVVFIDEGNRVDDEHRNVWLPLMDGTGRVTNPLSGEVIERHSQCFIIMAGNRGLQFTGTSAVDPAFTSRALVYEFEYLDQRSEAEVAVAASGCDAETALVFTRFAEESRAKARLDPDFNPISTREVIMACRLVAGGLTRDLAAKFAVINASSNEGGGASLRNELETIWGGVRVTKEELDLDGDDYTKAKTKAEWRCTDHPNFVPTAVLDENGAYMFHACDVPGCDENSAQASALECDDCGTTQPFGRTAFCVACGAVLS